jgi:acyl-CoA hydrolase
MAEIVLPEDSNSRGTIFGGRVLALIDKCAAIAAMRHAQTEVVTASLDSVDFHSSVRLGNILVLKGRLNAVFRSSMEVEVEVHAEDPFGGARRLTTRAFVTMVAMGPSGTPIPAPPLLIEDDDARARLAAAEERRRARVARRT